MSDEDTSRINVDHVDIVVSEKDKGSQNNKKFNWLVVSSIIALFGIGYQYFPIFISWYIQKTYLPDSIITHYIENPLKDVSLRVSLRYESDFKFPDLPETLDIQFTSRIQNEFNSLVHVKVDIQTGTLSEYLDDKYPVDELFISCKLSDTNAIQVDGSKNYGELYFTLESLNNNDFPFFFTQLIVDHCYRSELERYAPDKFCINKYNDNNYFITHQDDETHPVLSKLINKDIDDQIEIVLHYYIVADDLLNLDMRSAIIDHTIKLLDSIPNLFKLAIHLETVPFQEGDIDYDDLFFDENFDIQLSTIPILKDIYRKTRDAEAESEDLNLHFIFYPFIQGGEAIKMLNVHRRDLYSSIENTYLKLGDWGSVYFAQLHEPNQDGRFFVNRYQLADAMWTFNEAMLDTLGVPSEVLSPYLRIDTFKRYMTVQYLTKYSMLLHKLRSQLRTESISVWRMKELAECFATTLEMRQQIIIDLTEKETLKALESAERMVHLMKTTL